MKTKSRILASIAPLIIAATAVFAVSAAHAQAPTVITTAPYSITKAGTYQLGANLTYAGTGASNDAIISIKVSDVTLDFNGHFISGPTANAGTSLNGVYANEHRNVIIKNGTISACSNGIYLSGTGNDNSNAINQRVENMVVTRCYSVGIFLNSVQSSSVLDCNVSSIGGSTVNNSIYGMLCLGTGIKLSNNTVTNVVAASSSNSYGISAYTPGIFAIGNTISHCTVGISGAKYKDNLTDACGTPFSGGNDAGGNDGDQSGGEVIAPTPVAK